MAAATIIDKVTDLIYLLISFDPLTTRFEFNMIYVKDGPFVKARLASADSILMSGQVI